MLVVILCVLVLYLLFRKFLYKPVNNLLIARKGRVASEINGAKTLKEEAEHLRIQQEEVLEQVKIEAQETIENAKIFGERMKETIIEDAKRSAKDIMTKALSDADREKRIAMEEVKKQSVELAVLIASRILEENISLEKHNMLISNFIDEVGISQ
jgi:F-type H+-transporting ATPase subunit b